MAADDASAGTTEQRLDLAHRARRASEHQLDDIRRALCDAGMMRDDDPYSHADLADVIRQNGKAASPPVAAAWGNAFDRANAAEERADAATRVGVRHMDTVERVTAVHETWQEHCLHPQTRWLLDELGAAIAGHPTPDSTDGAVGTCAYARAVERTRARMQEYAESGSRGVNPHQVLGLLSLTWPDGNYEAPVPEGGSAG